MTVASDNCPSREDKPELTDGGIGYMLRRLVAERARTAREGVLLAGKLVERFGYIDSGRTYIIADPDEGWLFCVVNGKHWLARRVPDNEVAMVANTYTIRAVNLRNKANFLASADIVDYAKSRGWYDPQTDGPFDFRQGLCQPEGCHPPEQHRTPVERLDLTSPATSSNPARTCLFPSCRSTSSACWMRCRSCGTTRRTNPARPPPIRRLSVRCAAARRRPAS